jgi:hypothetical protein
MAVPCAVEVDIRREIESRVALGVFMIEQRS